jgi:hypothetical protein
MLGMMPLAVDRNFARRTDPLLGMVGTETKGKGSFDDLRRDASRSSTRFRRPLVVDAFVVSVLAILEPVDEPLVADAVEPGSVAVEPVSVSSSSLEPFFGRPVVPLGFVARCCSGPDGRTDRCREEEAEPTSKVGKEGRLITGGGPRPDASSGRPGPRKGHPE